MDMVVEPDPSEKYEFVNWNDEIPDIWKNKKMFQTTNQSLENLQDFQFKHALSEVSAP